MNKVVKQRTKRAIFILLTATIFLLLVYYLPKLPFVGLLNTTIKNQNTQTDDNIINNLADFSTLNIYDYKVSSGGNIIGFCLRDNCENAFENVKNLLEHNGWRYINSNNKFYLNFYSDENNRKWIVVNLVAIGGDTSVVIQSG